MKRSTVELRVALASCALAAFAVPLVAADSEYGSLDAKAIAIRPPADMQWKGGDRGIEQIVLAGDPSKPGLYVVLAKWYPHRNSRPHFHPNDRYITVISGTWWVGTGRKYDESSMRPVPAGSFVTHFAKEVHYDGARDGEVILQIVGMGPATANSAEDR